MGARELLHELADAGITIEVEADKLVIRPASKLTDDLRAELRAAKPELMALLSMPNSPMRAAASSESLRVFLDRHGVVDVASSLPHG